MWRLKKTQDISKLESSLVDLRKNWKIHFCYALNSHFVLISKEILNSSFCCFTRSFVGKALCMGLISSHATFFSIAKSHLVNDNKFLIHFELFVATWNYCGYDVLWHVIRWPTQWPYRWQHDRTVSPLYLNKSNW